MTFSQPPQIKIPNLFWPFNLSRAVSSCFEIQQQSIRTKRKEGREKPGDKTNLIILFWSLPSFCSWTVWVFLFVDLIRGGLLSSRKNIFGLFLPPFLLRHSKNQVIYLLCSHFGFSSISFHSFYDITNSSQ